MVLFLLLIAGNILAVTSGLNLNCTNDFDTLMSCYTDAHNCSGLRMTLLYINDHTRTGRCEFEACVRGCCCLTSLEFLAFRDKFTANVFKDGQSVHTQTILVDNTIKPPTPSVTSVEPINGIYRVHYRTNAKMSVREDLMAVVTFQKKGGNDKISERDEPSRGEKDESYFEIRSQNLEPNTAYVVSVKTYTSFGVYSDNSNEEDVPTNSSTNGGLIAVILCLSVAAIIISAAAFALSVKLKGKFWDKAAKNERPKILDIKPKKEVILTPESLSVYSLSVEPLVSKHSLTSSKEETLSESRSGQTSGISTASSSLDYADTRGEVCFDMEALLLEALRTDFPIFTPSFSPEEPAQVSASPPYKSLETTSSPMSFNNNIYFTSNNPNADEVNLQLTCDTAYHSSEGPPLEDFITSPHDSVTMETDMSYQSCGASGGAVSDSQTLPVNYGYQGFEKLVERSNSKTEECQSLVQGVDDPVPHVSNEMIVEPGYRCV